MPGRERRPNYGSYRVMRVGYIGIWEPDHPLAMADGYVLEHRKVAWDAGLFTDPSLHVHHRNGNKVDNRLGNLQVMTCAEHSAMHSRERGARPPHKWSENHWKAKLTQENVNVIRAAWVPRKVTKKMLAARFGVSVSTINAVLSGRNWKHDGIAVREWTRGPDGKKVG